MPSGETYELTHRGQSLADMERMESPDHSDDENESKHLSTDQTNALFGGGIFEKKDHKEIH